AGRKPWPYRTVDRDDGPGKRLEPIPERAEAILEAYRRVLAGGSLNGIATDWTERGLLPDPLRSGRQPAWSVASIRRVLTNEALYGAHRHHGELVRNADGTVRIDPHRVIVSRAEWVRVNDLLNRPDRAVKHGEHPTPLLHQLASCGRCGRWLFRVAPTGKPPIYRCTRPGCYTSIQAEQLEAHVEETYLDLFGDRPVMEHVGGRDTDAENRRIELQEALQRVQEQFRTVSPEDAADLARRRNELAEALDALDRKSTRLNSSHVKISY